MTSEVPFSWTRVYTCHTGKDPKKLSLCSALGPKRKFHRGDELRAKLRTKQSSIHP